MASTHKGQRVCNIPLEGSYFLCPESSLTFSFKMEKVPSLVVQKLIASSTSSSGHIL